MMLEIFGFVGFFLLLVAYVLCLFAKIKQESPFFEIMNIIGGLMIAYYAYKVDGLIITSIPFFWAVISFYYLVTHKKRQKEKL